MEMNKTLASSGGRITVIDALRGFSLIGICLIHGMQHFGAMGTMAPQAMFPWEGTLDEIFRWFINYLVFGKFFIIFSCLFGLSFFIQMDRAAQKGVDFRARFLWRLVLLLVIGFVHGLLVRVDILLVYALLGFVLVLMYKWPTKLLVGITLFLFLGGANGRVRWKDYYQLGYIPYPESMGSTAQTLEYCYDDFCAYQLAKMTGNKFYEEVFARQIYNYKNVYDPSVGFMRGRKLDGSWADFDAFEWGGPYCEGNAWHYNWSVFHDVQGLIDLTGGDERFVAKIDSVFALPGIVKYGTYGTKIHEMLEMELAKMGQYAQGNQPIQHMIYLYSYAGQPWKTQYWIRQVMDRLYNSSENGYPGDEDQGGMSSWYVLSALGIYSVCPGTDEYVLGSPKFRKTTITMEDGKKFVIEAKGNSKDNVYIQNATLNGKRHTRNYIHYSDIVNGGVLELQMGNQPEKTRGTAKEDRPFSLSK